MRLIDADKLNIYDVSPAYGTCVMGITEEDIELAPTVEAEPVQWIPTNVALPNVGDRVLISTKKKVYIAEYTGENAKGHSVWHCYEEWEFHTFWEPEVKAWAVLPKVYGKRPEE